MRTLLVAVSSQQWQTQVAKRKLEQRSRLWLCSRDAFKYRLPMTEWNQQQPDEDCAANRVEKKRNGSWALPCVARAEGGPPHKPRTVAARTWASATFGPRPPRRLKVTSHTNTLLVSPIKKKNFFPTYFLLRKEKRTQTRRLYIWAIT